MQVVTFVVVLLGVVAEAAPGPVVVTGATGRTGFQVYNLMKNIKGREVRALVRNATKARDLLKCTKCDESEGIFEGDITKPETLKAVMAGASALIIATSAAPHMDDKGKLVFNKGAEPIDIDWHGAQNQLTAFAERAKYEGSGAAGKGQIALISTAGTETPEDSKGEYFMDYIGFYKLNFEAELMTSGIPFTIIKPCGLDYSGTEPAQKELVTGHDGSIAGFGHSIARADVARLMVAAIEMPAMSAGLRFDVCSKDGTPTTDAQLGAVLQTAKYPWQKQQPVV